MKRFVSFFLASMFSAAALAGGGGGHASGPAAAPGAPFVDLPPFMAPLVANGELRAYMYIVLKVEVKSDGQKGVVLEKVPYLQDAILRAVHATPITDPNDPDKVAEPALLQRLTPVVEGVLGPGVLERLEFRTLTKAAH
jgi:hypothetical protein